MSSLPPILHRCAKVQAPRVPGTAAVRLTRVRAQRPQIGSPASGHAANRWARGAAIVEARGGDALWIAHDDAAALAEVARHIIDEVYQAPSQPRLRIALHHGDVQTRQRDGDPSPAIAGGDAILCTARVEPHVEPGQIWATEEFRQQLLQKPSLWRRTVLAGPDGGPRFNVKKEGSTEPDLWVQLYRLEF